MCGRGWRRGVVGEVGVAVRGEEGAGRRSNGVGPASGRQRGDLSRYYRYRPGRELSCTRKQQSELHGRGEFRSAPPPAGSRGGVRDEPLATSCTPSSIIQARGSPSYMYVRFAPEEPSPPSPPLPPSGFPSLAKPILRLHRPLCSFHLADVLFAVSTVLFPQQQLFFRFSGYRNGVEWTRFNATKKKVTFT